MAIVASRRGRSAGRCTLVEGGRVLPPAGRAYVDRSRVRRGMAVAGGTLVRAFASVGWLWGGRWAGTPDYQHFSSTGG